ncbi:hypothetical protein [Litorihabitans aurantiacus]|uniref:Uncharacterized protein n=1 Tax=Litorihabitans aurantiacus TaxID=1930061 RepID=A0AA38CW89_9MICO|nr:hypothetical protein [Litorihabitans aurantiacus]GMA32802.1 hypothetical protein GCM10025875_27940 [Litorihabitans aurantiacus]
MTPIPINAGDASTHAYDSWVAVLRAEPTIWSGDAAVGYAQAWRADVALAQALRDRIDEAERALALLHSSRIDAHLALQGYPPSGGSTFWALLQPAPVVPARPAPIRPIERTVA